MSSWPRIYGFDSASEQGRAMQEWCRTAAPPPNNRVVRIYYILLAFVSKHVPILKLSSIPIKFKVISSSAVRELSFSYSKQLTYWCHFLLRWTASTFYDSNTRAFSLPLLLSCGRYRTAFSAAKELFGCRLCLSSARAISVKCFEVHVFIYSDQMVSSIFIYIICIYLYLNCALCSPLSVNSMGRH